ncbi:MAG: type I-U CRISPR-associated protein Csx17 [Myxococcota bacterium]|nr:type I-U CRISPR-associated protein Csx17 [Myxococcota bacterium]
MTLHLHHLTGCAPAPLAHYLKALGILRLVAEQVDPKARGWWQDEHFCLLTTLDRDALESFFLHAYAPTPFVSPWNRGSGFFAARDKGLNPIEISTASRFAPFRAGIAAARAELAQLDDAATYVRALKDTTKSKKGKAATARKDDPAYKRELAAAEKRFKALKLDLFKPFDLAWRGPHRAWMEAALVLPEGGSPMFPSLLGTGGNDGRLDFTNNAMQGLGELFELAAPAAGPRSGATDLLGEALWMTATNQLSSSAIGQFLPGDAGGANSTTGFDGGCLINPWDFVLMMEGTILFSARSTRRLGVIAAARASAPFAVHAHAVGHGTPGDEKAERGEQWMPLWSAPCVLTDLSTMLGEARLQLGRQTALRPIDVALAVARLGVARGVSEFVRFGYLERYGQNNLAVPLGRIHVRGRGRSRLIDDLGPWLDRLQRLARDKHAPSRLTRAEQRLADTVFDALLHDDEPARWQAVLLAAGAIEELQLGGTATRAGPIPPLTPAWLVAADDGSTAWRLAVALGSAAATYDRRNRRVVDPIRHHWLPLNPGARRYNEREKRLARDPRVVVTGRDAIGDCAAIVERRLVEASAKSHRRLALEAAPGCDAQPADLAELLSGTVDLSAVLSLARALMPLQWSRVGARASSVKVATWPEEAWMAVRLAHLAFPLAADRHVTTDIAIVRRLGSGDAATAVELSLRRLHAAGLRPPLAAATTTAENARLWAAALAFPISFRTARAMARRFEPSNSQENR